MAGNENTFAVINWNTKLSDVVDAMISQKIKRDKQKGLFDAIFVLMTGEYPCNNENFKKYAENAKLKTESNFHVNTLQQNVLNNIYGFDVYRLKNKQEKDKRQKNLKCFLTKITDNTTLEEFQQKINEWDVWENKEDFWTNFEFTTKEGKRKKITFSNTAGSDQKDKILTLLEHLVGGNSGHEYVDKKINIWEKSKQFILYGPPGTGKTKKAKEIAEKLIGNRNEITKRLKLIQFHPSYSYYDFVQGIEIGENGKFQSVSKIFKTFAKEAKEAKKAAYDKGETVPNYVLIIDEINRADISSVFGELLYALEYRDQPITISVATQDGSSVNDTICVPDNLYIIGTMNTADKSIANMDYAVRRRFAFEQVPAQELSEKQVPENKMFLGQLYDKVQNDISSSVARGVAPEDIMPGVSYYLVDKNDKDNDNYNINHAEYKIKYELMPLLTEYAHNGLFSKRKKIKINNNEQEVALVEAIKAGTYQTALIELINKSLKAGES